MKLRWAIVVLVLLAGCARFQSQPISPSQTAAKLDARALDNPAFKSFLEKNLPSRAVVWPPKSWDFETLSLAALYYHPSLDVARAQWQVALGGDVTAAQRPNPTVSVIPGYDFNSTGLSPWLPAITFDVPVETAGKRGYRMAQAHHLSESARFDIATAAWLVRSELRSSLIEFAAAQQRQAVLEKQKSIQGKIIGSLEQQLEAGAVSAYDTGLARLAYTRVELDLTDARRIAVDARGRVAEAIGVPLKALDGIELSYDFSAPLPAAEITSTAAREQALRNRTDILSALSDYAASQSALQLEIAKQYPDIHLGPGYQFDHGEHTFTLALTTDLPLLNQNQGPIAEARARRAESAAKFIALQAKVIAEIDRAVAGYQITRENLAALDSLAAAGKKQSDAIAAQVQAGAASRQELLIVQLDLSANEISRLDGQVRLQQSFAALENAVQRPIETLKPSLIERGPANAMR